MKKIFGLLALAAILTTTMTGVASAQGRVVPMVCSTVYGNGHVVFLPAHMHGRSCWLHSHYGRIFGELVRVRAW